MRQCDITDRDQNELSNGPRLQLRCLQGSYTSDWITSIGDRRLAVLREPQLGNRELHLPSTAIWLLRPLTFLAKRATP